MLLYFYYLKRMIIFHFLEKVELKFEWVAACFIKKGLVFLMKMKF
jgi:hypothetical protein